MLILLTCVWQVSGVAFDSYWSAPNSDGTDENVVYRFGSVGQVHFQNKRLIFLSLHVTILLGL